MDNYKSNEREFIREGGRNMFKNTHSEYCEKGLVDVYTTEERKKHYGFLLHDIVSITGAYPIGEVEIVTIQEHGHAGFCELKVLKPKITLDRLTNKKRPHYPVGKILEYGIDVLSYATLVKQSAHVKRNTPITPITPITPTTNINISKYDLEIIDFSNSKIDWQIDMYNENGINIGIIVNKDGVMCDEDILSELPELKNLELGEIQMDEGGFLGITSDLTLSKIEEKIKNLGFIL